MTDYYVPIGCPCCQEDPIPVYKHIVPSKVKNYLGSGLYVEKGDKIALTRKQLYEAKYPEEVQIEAAIAEEEYIKRVRFERYYGVYGEIGRGGKKVGVDIRIEDFDPNNLPHEKEKSQGGDQGGGD